MMPEKYYFYSYWLWMETTMQFIPGSAVTDKHPLNIFPRTVPYKQVLSMWQEITKEEYNFWHNPNKS